MIFIKFIEQINFENLLNVECAYSIKKISDPRLDSPTLHQTQTNSSLKI